MAGANVPTMGNDQSQDIERESAGDGLIPFSEFTPEDAGFLAWTYDPVLTTSSGTVLTSGTLQVIALKASKALTLNSVVLNVASAGVTLTSGQNLVGIYQNGALLGQTADQSAVWTGAGAKVMALTAPVTVQPGIFYVVVMSNGTTPAGFNRGFSTGLANQGLVRWGTANTGQTALPANLGAITPVSLPIWAGVL